MKICVTGGAGFIGATLVQRLNSAGVEVVVLDDLSTGNRLNLKGLDVDLRIGSVLDPDSVRDAIKGAHSVVHLAAVPSVARSLVDPVTSHQVNAGGTLVVLEAAREFGAHVISASSSSVYGRNSRLPKSEDMVPMPVSPYAVSKLAAESYTLAYGSCFGLKSITFRFFNVFGPLQSADHAYAAVIPAFVSAALRRERLVVHGDGTQTRDFTFVDSVAQVLLTSAMARTHHDEPVNLAFGGRTSLNELITMLSEILGRTLDVVYLPPRAGDVPHSQAASTTLRRLIPDVETVSLETGLKQTIGWMESVLRNEVSV